MGIKNDLKIDTFDFKELYSDTIFCIRAVIKLGKGIKIKQISDSIQIYNITILSYIKDLIYPRVNYQRMRKMAYSIIERSLIEVINKGICSTGDDDLFRYFIKSDYDTHKELSDYILSNGKRFFNGNTKNEREKVVNYKKEGVAIKQLLGIDRLELQIRNKEFIRPHEKDLFKFASEVLKVLGYKNWKNYYTEVYKLDTMFSHSNSLILYDTKKYDSSKMESRKKTILVVILMYISYLTIKYKWNIGTSVRNILMKYKS